MSLVDFLIGGWLVFSMGEKGWILFSWGEEGWLLFSLSEGGWLGVSWNDDGHMVGWVGGCIVILSVGKSKIKFKS